MRYRHKVTIIIETQHPKTEEFPQLVKDMLGPWCIDAKATVLNSPFSGESEQILTLIPEPDIHG